MLQRGLLPDFSAAAVAEANAAQASGGAGTHIRDLRGLLWASIDNDDSRDLDQLSVSERVADGAVKILVAVADVGATVRRDSAIDEHAKTNTTSVYTAAEIFPMLPEKLSTDLTSLAEGEDRLAVVIDMVVGDDGSIRKSDVYCAVVRNRAKLAYNAVAAWLDGIAPVPPRIAAVAGLDAQLRAQDRVAQTMKGLRHQHGDSDPTVNAQNAAAIVEHATVGRADKPLRTSVNEGAAGGRTYRRTVYAEVDGQPVVEHWVLHGAGHAWSGGSSSGSFTDATGPDASAEMIRFFYSQPRPGTA